MTINAKYCLIIRAKKSIENYSIIKFLASYQENEFWKSLRKSYNYIKHSGAFHISGLGIKPKKRIMM